MGGLLPWFLPMSAERSTSAPPTLPLDRKRNSFRENTLGSIQTLNLDRKRNSWREVNTQGSNPYCTTSTSQSRETRSTSRSNYSNYVDQAKSQIRLLRLKHNLQNTRTAA